MTSERIKEIQYTTAYPESVSVQQALLKVWHECETEKQPQSNPSKLVEDEQLNFHLQKIKDLESKLKEKTEYAALVKDVFLRRTGAIRLDDNWYKIQEVDLLAFFLRFDSTKKLTQYDKL